VLVDSEKVQVAKVMSLHDAWRQGCRTKQAGGSAYGAFTISSIPGFLTDTMVLAYLNNLIITDFRLGASAGGLRRSIGQGGGQLPRPRGPAHRTPPVHHGRQMSAA
jgi:hypothetical protein